MARPAPPAEIAVRASTQIHSPGRLPVQVHGELGVDEQPLGDVELAGQAVAAVRDREHPLQRAGLLVGDEGVAQPGPHLAGPGSAKWPPPPATRRRTGTRRSSPRGAARCCGRAGGWRVAVRRHAAAGGASTRQALARATSRRPRWPPPPGTPRCGPADQAACTSSSPTGMAPRISQVNRATIMSSRGAQCWMARPRSALGGPPCRARSSQGPVVCAVARQVPLRTGRRSYRPPAGC